MEVKESKSELSQVLEEIMVKHKQRLQQNKKEKERAALKQMKEELKQRDLHILLQAVQERTR